ncbi:MAG: hypothetical protein HZA53_13265 [Planctomycetes bacterium]|nr:hypothetical protein [Planctomycetota bacterium]
MPDSTGTPIANVTFGNTLDDCVLDATGNVFFRGQLVDSVTPVTGVNDRGMFYGSSRATLRMAARGGDQAPSMAPGILLRTTAGTSSSLSGTPRVSPDGRLWWGSQIYDGGVTVTTTNNSALFAGPFGSQSLVLRSGDVAPGTGGANFSEAFAAPAQAFLGMNQNGVMFLRAVLATGSGTPAVNTTTGTNNSQGLWVGPPGGLVLVARKSDPVQGLGGEVAIDNSNSLSFHMELNGADRLLFDITLSTTQGVPAATAANDRVLMVNVPVLGNQVLVRESDVAPGTSGGTFNSISVTDNWGPSLAQNAWLRTSEVIFHTELRGGDTVAGVNDKAIYRGGVGSLSMVSRRGDVAFGTGGATYNGFNTSNILHNVTGHVVFQAFLNLTGGVTSADDSGIWYGLPGSLQLVAREGQSMPGTTSTCGALNGANVFLNDANQVLFVSTLAGGDRSGTSLWIWDEVAGLRAVVFNNDQVEVSPGVFKPINSSTGVPGNTISNTDGAAMTFGHDGTVAMRVSFTDNTRAIMTVHVPPSSLFQPFCFGDGLDMGHTTPCPCANNGASGNGCANSVNPSGANLSASGSTTLDDVTLGGSLMPATSSCIYLQGDTLEDTSFGDGVRCAGGSLIRLRTRFNVGGASTFPNSTDTITLSARGGVVPGSAAVRYYQTYYRNAAPLFCPPETFNVTNGVRVTW